MCGDMDGLKEIEMLNVVYTITSQGESMLCNVNEWENHLDIHHHRY